jgi:hypothetical protein
MAEIDNKHGVDVDERIAWAFPEDLLIDARVTHFSYQEGQFGPEFLITLRSSSTMSAEDIISGIEQRTNMRFKVNPHQSSYQVSGVTVSTVFSLGGFRNKNMFSPYSLLNVLSAAVFMPLTNRVNIKANRKQRPLTTRLSQKKNLPRRSPIVPPH